MLEPLALGAALALAAPVVSAGDLAVGDPAPALEHVEWLRGRPVMAYEPGQVYVLDFWATWCGPCIRSIPHINELEQARKDDGVNVIGLAIWPSPNMTPTDEYIAEQGEAMDYRIAEDIDGQTADAFMKAAGQNGIPTCMVVDGEGRLAWIGHPMAGLDDVVDQVVAGTWDIEAAAAEFKQQAEAERRQMELQKKAQPLVMALRKADEEQDWKTVAEKAEELAALGDMFTGWIVQAYVARVKLGDKDAREFGKGLVEQQLEDDVGALNQLAWTLVAPDRTLTDAQADLEVALAAAERADALTEHADPNVLDTLARVHFRKGDTAKAIELQELAVEIAPEQMKDYLGRALTEYEGS